MRRRKKFNIGQAFYGKSYIEPPEGKTSDEITAILLGLMESTPGSFISEDDDCLVIRKPNDVLELFVSSDWPGTIWYQGVITLFNPRRMYVGNITRTAEEAIMSLRSRYLLICNEPTEQGFVLAQSEKESSGHGSGDKVPGL